MCSKQCSIWVHIYKPWHEHPELYIHFRYPQVVSVDDLLQGYAIEISNCYQRTPEFTEQRRDYKRSDGCVESQQRPGKLGYPPDHKRASCLVCGCKRIIQYEFTLHANTIDRVKKLQIRYGPGHNVQRTRWWLHIRISNRPSRATYGNP